MGFESLKKSKLAVVLEALCSMLMVILQMVVVVYMIRNLFLGFVPMDIRNRTDILVRLRHHSGGPVTSGFVFVAVGFVSLIIWLRFLLLQEY
jgi:hypothetical protein